MKNIIEKAYVIASFILLIIFSTYFFLNGNNIISEIKSIYDKKQDLNYVNKLQLKIDQNKEKIKTIKTKQEELDILMNNYNKINENINNLNMEINNLNNSNSVLEEKITNYDK